MCHERYKLFRVQIQMHPEDRKVNYLRNILTPYQKSETILTQTRRQYVPPRS
jgi:hypothetical protein